MKQDDCSTLSGKAPTTDCETRVRVIETIYNGYRFRSRLEARWAVFFDALGVEYEYEPEGFELPNGDQYLPDFRVKCYGKRGACRDPQSMSDAGIYGLCAVCKYRTEEGMYSYQYNCANDTLKRNEYGSVDCAECDGDLNSMCVKCDGFALDTGDSFDLYIEVKGHMSQEDAEKILNFAKSYPVLVVSDIPANFSDMAERGDTWWGNGMDGTDVYQFNYRTIDGDYFGAYPAAHNGYFYLMGADSNYINGCDIESINKACIKARQVRFEHGETPRVAKARR